MNKNQKKRLKYGVARLLLHFLECIFYVIPYSLLDKTANFFSAVTYRILKNHRRVAYDTISVCYQDTLSEQEKKTLVKDCFYNFVRVALDALYFAIHPQFIDDQVYLDKESQVNLDEAIKNQHGTVAVSAHFGNFLVMLFYFARKGYPVSIILRPSRDPKIDLFLEKWVKRLNLNLIYSMPRKQCVLSAFKALKEGHMLFTLMDQNYGSKGGVFVDFFGQKAATATGPIVFAMRSKKPMLPVFITREADKRYRIIVDQPVAVEEKQNDQDTIYHNTAKMTSIIEKYIREYPHEWAWMHRRFKTQAQSVDQKEVGA